MPYIGMSQPWVSMCSPSWTPLPPPSPSHPSGSFQCTNKEFLLKKNGCVLVRSLWRCNFPRSGPSAPAWLWCWNLQPHSEGSCVATRGPRSLWSSPDPVPRSAHYLASLAVLWKPPLKDLSLFDLTQSLLSVNSPSLGCLLEKVSGNYLI